MEKYKRKYSVYAVRLIEYGQNLIFFNWYDVEVNVKGRINMIKGFNSVDDAKDWLLSITEKDDELVMKRVEKGAKRKEAEEIEEREKWLKEGMVSASDGEVEDEKKRLGLSKYSKLDMYVKKSCKP